MTIRTGEPWGSETDRPADLRIARSDAELAAWVADDPDGSYGVDGGDLHRTVGAPLHTGASPAARVHRLPIDVLDVVADGSHHLAIAHVVVRRGWWRGPLSFVGNVGLLGTWNVAPRAHPNDGRLDVVDVDASMRVRDRREAHRRLPTGTHVPHPAISVRRATEWTWAGPDGAHVWIDGVDVGPRSTITVRIVPDAAAVMI